MVIPRTIFDCYLFTSDMDITIANSRTRTLSHVYRVSILRLFIGNTSILPIVSREITGLFPSGGGHSPYPAKKKTGLPRGGRKIYKVTGLAALHVL